MSLMRINKDTMTVSFPRVSGDEPQDGVTKTTRYLFSPRERG